MANFYFTYGSDKEFPYQNGYTKIEAKDLNEAYKLFNAVHPKRKGSNCINCAFVYTDDQWSRTNMSKMGDKYPCHEIIRTVYLAPEYHDKAEPYIAVMPLTNNEVIISFYGD